MESADQRPSAFHTHPGGAQRHHHGVRICTDRGITARAVVDHGALGYAAGVGGSLFGHPGDGRPDPSQDPARAQPGGLRSRAGSDRSVVDHGIARNSRTAVCLPGRSYFEAAAGHRDARGAHLDPGLREFRTGVLAQSASGRVAQRCMSFSLDWRQQFLRIGSGGSDQPVRI